MCVSSYRDMNIDRDGKESMWELKMVWKDGGTEWWQSKQQPLGASCEIRKSEHDNSWCDKRLVTIGAAPLSIPSEWQESALSRSRSHGRRCMWLYIQRGPQHVGTVWIHFRCTDQVLPSVSLEHALQKSCSTDIRTIQRMNLWRLSSTSTQPWS